MNAPAEVASAEDALWAAFAADRSEEARSRLFALYQSYARRLARRCFLDRARGDIEFPDLCQLAYAGLLEAIDRFDPARGAPFRAFAARRITGSVLDGLADMSELRRQASYRNRARHDRMRSLMDRPPTPGAERDPMEVLADLAIGLALGFMLEDAGLIAGEDTPDARPDGYESLAWKDDLKSLSDALAGLPERERAILRGHYFEDLDFDRLGAMLGVTRARISQLHRGALGLLRKRLSPGGRFRLER